MAHGHAAMRPFQSFAVDVLFEQPFFHHQAEIWPSAAPGGIGAFVNDMAQIIETARTLRPALREPFLTALPAFPGTGGEAQNLYLHATALQGAGQHVSADGSNGDGATAHRAGIVEQQCHAGVAEFGIFFDLKGQGRCGVGNHPRQTPRI